VEKTDFFNLTIDKRIYYKGKEKNISVLTDTFEIGFNDEISTDTWVNICSDCSLEPPKEKEKITMFCYIELNVHYPGNKRLIWSHADDLLSKHFIKVPSQDIEVFI